MHHRIVSSTTLGPFGLGLAVGLVLATAAFAFRGERSTAEPTGPSVAAPIAMETAGSGPASGNSMEAATLALRTRLQAKGGSDADWELLAQSYDFLGRREDAAFARQHKVSSTGGLAEAVSVSARLLPGSRPKSGTGPDILASADQHRRKREFAEACDDYRSLVALGQMTADSWADYADAQASLTGRLSGEPARAVEKALAMNPRHAKALWLKASLAHEEHRYGDALKVWQQLQDLVPPDSSDARIVAANIAEASRLSAG